MRFWSLVLEIPGLILAQVKKSCSFCIIGRINFDTVHHHLNCHINWRAPVQGKNPQSRLTSPVMVKLTAVIVGKKEPHGCQFLSTRVLVVVSKFDITTHPLTQQHKLYCFSYTMVTLRDRLSSYYETNTVVHISRWEGQGYLHNIFY